MTGNIVSTFFSYMSLSIALVCLTNVGKITKYQNYTFEALPSSYSSLSLLPRHRLNPPLPMLPDRVSFSNLYAVKFHPFLILHRNEAIASVTVISILSKTMLPFSIWVILNMWCLDIVIFWICLLVF